MIRVYLTAEITRDLFIYSVGTLHLILLTRTSNIKDKRKTPKDMIPALTDIT